MLASTRKKARYLLLIVMLIHANNSVRRRTKLHRCALLSPSESPWQRFYYYGGRSSFLLMTGLQDEIPHKNRHNSSASQDKDFCLSSKEENGGKSCKEVKEKEWSRTFRCERPTPNGIPMPIIQGEIPHQNRHNSSASQDKDFCLSSKEENGGKSCKEVKEKKWKRRF
jgi:hypothetical protein